MDKTIVLNVESDSDNEQRLEILNLNFELISVFDILKNYNIQLYANNKTDGVVTKELFTVSFEKVNEKYYFVAKR